MWVRVTAVGAVIAVLALGAWKVNSVLNENAELSASVAALTLSLEIETKKVDKVRSDLKAAELRLTTVNDQLQSARTEAAKVKEILSAHDFENLLSAKPGLVGRRMRDATARMHDALEAASRGDTGQSVPDTSEGR